MSKLYLNAYGDILAFDTNCTDEERLGEKKVKGTVVYSLGGSNTPKGKALVFDVVHQGNVINIWVRIADNPGFTFQAKIYEEEGKDNGKKHQGTGQRA